MAVCALAVAWPVTAVGRWWQSRVERLARYASRAALNITPSPIGIATGSAVRRALPCQQRMPQRAGGERRLAWLRQETAVTPVG